MPLVLDCLPHTGDLFFQFGNRFFKVEGGHGYVVVS